MSGHLQMAFVCVRAVCSLVTIQRDLGNISRLRIQPNYCLCLQECVSAQLYSVYAVCTQVV